MYKTDISYSIKIYLRTLKSNYMIRNALNCKTSYAYFIYVKYIWNEYIISMHSHKIYEMYDKHIWIYTENKCTLGFTEKWWTINGYISSISQFIKFLKYLIINIWFLEEFRVQNIPHFVLGNRVFGQDSHVSDIGCWHT